MSNIPLKIVHGQKAFISLRKIQQIFWRCHMEFFLLIWLGDKMSQRQNVPLHFAPPWRHNVPTDAPSLATFCPTFSIWIPIPWAKLARIWGISWIYLGQFLALSAAISIYKRKPLVNWHFSGDKLSHSTKCPTFSPATKFPNLWTDAQESCWKVVGSFCRLSHFVNLKANTSGKGCAFSEHVLDISWLHLFHLRQIVPITLLAGNKMSLQLSITFLCISA